MQKIPLLIFILALIANAESEEKYMARCLSIGKEFAP